MVPANPTHTVINAKLKCYLVLGRMGQGKGGYRDSSLALERDSSLALKRDSSLALKETVAWH